LFELRDQLREYEMRDGATANHKAVQYTHNSVNVAIYLIEFFDAALLYKSDRLVKSDPTLQSRIAKNAEFFDNYATEELKSIRQEANKILEEAFICHSIMLGIYMIPIALIVLLTDKIKDKIKERISEIMDIPEKDIYGMPIGAAPMAAKCY